MAKVSGPLMSMDASGKFGGALVFGKWKGRNTVRQLVIPTNPHSAGQEDARNRTRVTGEIQKWVNSTLQLGPGETKRDEDLIKAITPSGFAWNGFLTQTIIGKGDINYTAANTAYVALTAAEKTAWDTAAAGLTPNINPVYQTVAGGNPGTPISEGRAFFILRYGLFLMNLAPAPTGTPPAYT